MSKSGKPWEINSAWASGHIKSASSGAPGIWFFAILWNAISSPAVFMGIPEMYKSEKYWAIAVVAIFPLVGMLILYWAIYKTLQAVKYTNSTFIMDKVPGVIGGKFIGSLQLPAKLANSELINVRLVNIHEVTTGSGKNRSTRRNTIWQSTRNFKNGEWKIQNGHLTIPLDIEISYETKDHDRSNSRNCVYWNLEVYSEMPGIDFETSFEVPVFKTEDSDPELINSSKDEERVLERQPNMKGITYQELANGIRVFVHPFKFFGTGITMFSFGLIIGVVCIVLFYKSIFIPAVFTLLFSTLFVSFGIHFLLIQTEIVFYEDFGQVKSTWLGLGFIREFNLKDVKEISIDVKSSSSSNNGRETSNYSLCLHSHDGSQFSTSEMTSSYDQILWIKAKLKQKIDDIQS